MPVRDPAGRPRSLRIASVVTVAAAVIAVLAGCAPASSGPTGKLTKPSSPIHVAAPPTPTSTPSPSAPATPPNLVGVTCANLIPLATVKSLLVGTGVSPQPYEGNYYEIDQAQNIDRVALDQDGGLGCYWSNFETTAQLEVRVIPNASTAFAAAAPALTATDDVAEHLVSSAPTWGDKSYTDCGDKNFSGAACQFDILVGSYWININENRDKFVTGPAYPEDAGQKAAVAAIVASVKALPAPAAAWVPPAAASKIPTSCGDFISNATAKAAISASSVSLRQGPIDIADPWNKAVYAATGALDCEWNAFKGGGMSDVEIAVQPGSSWAWSTTSQPVHDKASFPYAPISGIGDAAMGACNTGLGECQLYAEVDKSWFLVELNDDHPSLSTAETVAKAFVTAAS